MTLLNATETCRCAPHAACANCDAPIHWDRVSRRALDAHEGYHPHRCPPPPSERMVECVCGLVVWLQADGRKLLHPNRAQHRPHPHIGGEAWERWIASEEKRALQAGAPASRLTSGAMATGLSR